MENLAPLITVLCNSDKNIDTITRHQINHIFNLAIREQPELSRQQLVGFNIKYHHQNHINSVRLYTHDYATGKFYITSCPDWLYSKWYAPEEVEQWILSKIFRSSDDLDINIKVL